MIELVINARHKDLGGFEVGRVLPWTKRRMVGPFTFYDHMGPVQMPPQIPQRTDVRPHPHIGLSTVTYLFAGEIVHRDSLGCHQVIRPGEVNWMTAGRGISHSERFETMREQGGMLDGVQAWVALPDDQEEIDPAFVHYDAAQLPSVQRDGAWIRVIAGEAFGEQAPVQVHSPLFYTHAELQPGAQVEMEAEHSERAVYVAKGQVLIDGERFAARQMIVFAAGANRPVIRAEEASAVMMLGGEPLGPRHIWWNFVSSRRERIEQAKADWKAGRFVMPVGDADEFIPLPEEPPPPPEPMS